MILRHLVPISGKDSLATAIVMKLWFPDKEIEYFYNQIGTELPPIYDWLDRVEIYLQKPIVRIGADLDAIIKEQGILPSDRMRFCTRLAKIEPMERYIGRDNPALVYFGIRADENRIGYKPLGKAQITPVYPLQLLDLNINDVWRICESVNLLPPSFFWQEIYNRVIELMPIDFIEALSPWERQSLFSWRSRPNCYYCFYQSQYEFIGLYCHYPDYFEKMCRLEEATGAENYTIRQGYKMRDLLARKDEIIDKRVTHIVQYLHNRFGFYNVKGTLKRDRIYQGSFSFDPIDSLQITSCGLFCGK